MLKTPTSSDRQEGFPALYLFLTYTGSVWDESEEVLNNCNKKVAAVMVTETHLRNAMKKLYTELDEVCTIYAIRVEGNVIISSRQ